MDVTASTSTDYTTSVFSKIDEGKTNDGPTDNDEVQKKCVLPPEYNENDSRWTLKYREPAPGLVELIEQSGVYVNADKLAECEMWSHHCNTFARMLLTEVFSTSALSTCSWTSEITVDNYGGQARPVLDEHAKSVLLKYIVKNGQIREWTKTDFQSIIKGIRQTMLDMRRVRQKAEQERESYRPQEPVKEKGFHKEQIILPPEYDRNNSRWTLKYRAYAPGLVEVIEDSCVYVELGQFAKFKRSTNSITLARMLLNDIFTKSALRTCCWNGLTPKDSGDATNGRPGLDENGVMSLLMFVSKYELENGWPVTDKRIIERRIRQKLELLRRVARKREEAGDAEERQRRIHRPGIDPPSEYGRVGCEIDTRWTLKYREPGAGLVELIEQSGVYVNADKLAEYTEKSNDCITLTQMLLTEVFSTTALSICTLSKKNNELFNNLHHNDTYLHMLQPRPELDPYAEIVLLNFIDEFTLEKGWTLSSFQSIRKSMMYQIHATREMYDYTL